MPAPDEYRAAQPTDAPECVEIRGLTRENALSVALSVARLAAMEITAQSWAESIRDNSLPGIVCLSGSKLVGYCFGDRQSGEVVVLAVLPEFENQGIGRALLDQLVNELSREGRARLFLGCSADPGSRSYGFYRYPGWRATSEYDSHCDEIIEYHIATDSGLAHR